MEKQGVIREGLTPDHVPAAEKQAARGPFDPAKLRTAQVRETQLDDDRAKQASDRVTEKLR